MFVKESPSSPKFQEAIKRFKANVRVKALKYLNTEFKIRLPTELDSIQLGEVSWLIAISILYKNHNEIEWDSESLHQQAKAICRTLFEEIFGKIYLPILEKVRNSNTSTLNLTPSQEKQALLILKEEGISSGSIFTQHNFRRAHDLNGAGYANFKYIKKNLLIKLIMSYPNLANCMAVDNEQLINQPIKIIAAAEKANTSNTEHKKKRKSPLHRIMLEDFIEHLVDDSPYKTFLKFKDAMTTQYIQADKERINDSDKYNEHDKIQHVYCVRSKQTKDEALKNIKYKIHYSIINDTGTHISQKPYSLSSFQKIFDTILSRKRAALRIQLTDGN